MTRTVLLLQSCACVRQTDAVARTGRDARAVISHGQVQPAVPSRGSDLDPSRSDAPRDAMTDRILDERLEDERRHGSVECLARDVDAIGKSVGEADTLDLEIRFDELQLLAQRNFVLRGAVERLPEQGAQA